MEAHHFCACPNEDVRQCVIYDSDKPNARLIGTEYIISDKLFETLPEEEKVYWHSHKYEVQSGTLQVCSPHALARQASATLRLPMSYIDVSQATFFTTSIAWCGGKHACSHGVIVTHVACSHPGIQPVLLLCHIGMYSLGCSDHLWVCNQACFYVAGTKGTCSG